MQTVYPYGTVELLNPRNDNIFKANGQRLKPFFEKFPSEGMSIPLTDPVYQDD